jgi:hypothetical protein
MQVSERDRHELYEWAREAMGSDRADVFMRYLPPVGWGDVATRRDLEVLGAGLRAEFRIEMAELRTEMADRFRRQTNVIVTTVLGAAGLIVALGGLLAGAVRYF